MRRTWGWQNELSHRLRIGDAGDGVRGGCSSKGRELGVEWTTLVAGVEIRRQSRGGQRPCGRRRGEGWRGADGRAVAMLLGAEEEVLVVGGADAVEEAAGWGWWRR